MSKINVRYTLRRIENPTIYDEFLQAEKQGIKPGETDKRLLHELVHLRKLVEVLQGSIIPYEPANNGQVSQTADENLLDILD